MRTEQVDNVTAHKASTERKEEGLYRRDIMARHVTAAQRSAEPHAGEQKSTEERE